MIKASKNYQKIIGDLDSLKDYCYEMSKEEKHASWQQDIQTLQEAMDIISDYEKTVADYNRMIQRYETPERAIRKSEDLYTCPHCGRRVNFNHSHCHYCGKKLGGWWK